MIYKRWVAILILCMLLLGTLPASAVAPSTAASLYAQYPELDFTLAIAPQTEPTLALVNRDHPLDSTFKPKVVTPQVMKKRGASIALQPEAAAALEAMFQAAESAGLELVAVSGYRSYSKQKTLYARSVERNGQEKADKMSARPGTSEHQLGLSMDLSCASLDNDLTSRFARKAEGKWVAEHCAEFGFIIRYKAEWTDTTGYQGEPWHIRYVGKQHATWMVKMDVPFEPYVAYLELAWQQQDTAQ